MHSTASDGTTPPEDLPALAAEAGLSAIALTDHDTTAGLATCAEAAAKVGLRFVPGIELSADPGKPSGTMHILGYGVRDAAPDLTAITHRLHAARAERAPRIVGRLRELGVDITMDEVTELAGRASIGRPHIAAVLLAKGYVKTVEHAFRRYIGQGGPAYFRKDQVDPADAISAIHGAGGLAVLAHPIQLRYEDDAELIATVSRLVDAGLNGVEVWHPDHRGDLVEQYARLAARFELIATGGSDFHGERKPNRLGASRVPAGVLTALDQKRCQDDLFGGCYRLHNSS